MTNLRKRTPMQTPLRAATAVRYQGSALEKLTHRPGECATQARLRAMRMPWWSRVINPCPVLSCGLWVWQVRV